MVPILEFYLQVFSSTWLSVWKQINTPGVQINHSNRRWWCPAAIFRLWAWSWVTSSIITPYLAAFYNKMVTSHHHNHITSASLISWPNDRNHDGCHKDQLWLFGCNWRASDYLSVIGESILPSVNFPPLFGKRFCKWNAHWHFKKCNAGVEGISGFYCDALGYPRNWSRSLLFTPN